MGAFLYTVSGASRPQSGTRQRYVGRHTRERCLIENGQNRHIRVRFALRLTRPFFMGLNRNTVWPFFMSESSFTVLNTAYRRRCNVRRMVFAFPDGALISMLFPERNCEVFVLSSLAFSGGSSPGRAGYSRRDETD